VQAVIAEIGNCNAVTLGEFFATAEIYRNASLRATARSPSWHQITVNPSKDHSREKLIEAAHRVRREFDAGTRPYAIVFHRKPRAEPLAEPSAEPRDSSSEHFHLLISAVDERGKFLDDGWSKIATERLCLELAHDLGESAVVGRHFQPALRFLERTRPEVVAWLADTVGLNPEKPVSAISSKSRARAKAQGLNLPKAKAAVRAAKTASSDVGSFRTNLAKLGFAISPGEKPRVWVIIDSQARLIGAADRLLKIRRGEFHAFMETTADEPETKLTNADSRRPRIDRENEPVDRPDLAAGARGDGFGQSDNPPADRNRARAAGATRMDREHQRKTRLTNRKFRRILRSSSQHHGTLIAALTAIAATTWWDSREHAASDIVLNPDLTERQDLWGIGQLPKPRI
jgi:hypothetical protein